MKRILGGGIGVALTGVALLGGFSGVASAAPAAGTLKIWVTPQLSGPGGTIVVTGAVGDSGKTLTVTSTGKTSASGNYEKLLLKQGTIMVNTTQFNAALNSNSSAPTDYNSATCSASIVTSGPATVVSGTKAYAGVTGSLTLTATIAIVLPHTKSGSCNMSNSAKPVAQWASITGSGPVTF
jgi:hypothetical protein